MNWHVFLGQESHSEKWNYNTEVKRLDSNSERNNGVQQCQNQDSYVEDESNNVEYSYVFSVLNDSHSSYYID